MALGVTGRLRKMTRWRGRGAIGTRAGSLIRGAPWLESIKRSAGIRGQNRTDIRGDPWPYGSSLREMLRNWTRLGGLDQTPAFLAPWC